MYVDKVILYIFLVQFSVGGVASNLIEFFNKLPSTFWEKYFGTNNATLALMKYFGTENETTQGLTTTWDTLKKNTVGALPVPMSPEPRVLDARLHGTSSFRKKFRKKNATTTESSTKITLKPDRQHTTLKETLKTRRKGNTPLEIPYLTHPLSGYAFKMRRNFDEDSFGKDGLHKLDIDGNPYFQSGTSMRHIVGEIKDTEAKMSPGFPSGPPVVFVVRTTRVKGPIYTDESDVVIKFDDRKVTINNTIRT